MGVGIQDVLERVITEIPAPKGDADAPLKALIFDAVYDPYKGVIVYPVSYTHLDVYKRQAAASKAALTDNASSLCLSARASYCAVRLFLSLIHI